MAVNSGRKVYRKSISSRKRRRKAVIYALIVVLCLSAVSFIVYSVAGPIGDYFKTRKTSAATDPWTPPSLPDNAVAEHTPVGEGGENSPAQSGNALYFSACKIPASMMSSEDALKEALSQARSDGYTAAVVPLKEKGGAIYYNTASEMARLGENAVRSDLSAARIRELVAAAGLKPVASLNLLEDHNIYGEYKKGSYKFDASTMTWYDNNSANGGKPWLSPFDEDTQAYVAFLADEVSEAGFDAIVFEGIVFPPFRGTDLNHIGETVKNENRYLALMNIAKTVSDAAAANGVASIIRVSAEEIVGGVAELFRAELPQGSALLVYYAPHGFPKTVVYDNQEIVLSDMTMTDSTTAVFNIIAQKANGRFELIPYVDSAGLNQSDFNDVITAIIAADYGSYVIS
jgi:hypothetical protein